MAGTMSLDNSRLKLSAAGNKNHYPYGVVEEIEGLIRVQRDGQVQRPPIVPTVPCTFALQPGLLARDIVIDKATNLWARIYVSTTGSCSSATKLPLLVYFHGGGFCVGSASWCCYHEFLANLAAKSNCVIVSVNYRLAPESRLPAAYEDGFNALMWVKQQATDLNQCQTSTEHKWWSSRCDFSGLFLAGDSAGANIAYHVALRLEQGTAKPLCLKGTILVQPFFGGEARTSSEKHADNIANSALTPSASDTYWRLSLPCGANRDHPWCNPLANGLRHDQLVRLPTSMLVCVSEVDILKDRNLELCNALVCMGKKVEVAAYKGVGHAFQVLESTQLSRTRTNELISRISSFINK